MQALTTRIITDFAGNARYNVPIGHPILPDRDRIARFHLLCAWLRQCDTLHPCNKRSDLRKHFLTRVLDVGGLEDVPAPGWIRLVDAVERKSDQYIAVSHAWGPLTTDKKKVFCTSSQNLPQRYHRFHVAELPKSFQDVVKVTRTVGIRYLWIDPICIIQYGDEGADWKREAELMKDVYSVTA